MNSIPTHVQNWIIVDEDPLLTDWQFKFSPYCRYLMILTAEPMYVCIKYCMYTGHSAGQMYTHTKYTSDFIYMQPISAAINCDAM